MNRRKFLKLSSLAATAKVIGLPNISSAIQPALIAGDDLSQQIVSVKKIAAYFKVTGEMLDDLPALTSTLVNRLLTIEQ